MRYIKISQIYVLNFFILFLICSCDFLAPKAKKSNKIFITDALNSINIENLLDALLYEDKKLIPVKNLSKDGQIYYSFPLLIGEKNLTYYEIENWFNKGSEFFKEDRSNIKSILIKLHKFGVNTEIIKINNGALGLWVPYEKTIFIDEKVIKMGSRFFLDVLSHESIHVAQSCFAGSKESYPKRIGLPLDFSKKLELNLSHKFYSNNSKEEILIEREAFTYSKVEGSAIKLLEKFCI